MRKNILKLSVIALIGISIWACSKEEVTPVENSNQVTEPSMAGPVIKVKFTAGHTSAECVGQGICFAMGSYFGETYGKVHIPCQAKGSDCQWEAGWSSAAPHSGESGDYEMSIDNFSDDFFLMPARSVVLENVYLNIPEQVLLKVENTDKYLFKDVTVTESPIFDNI